MLTFTQHSPRQALCSVPKGGDRQRQLVTISSTRLGKAPRPLTHLRTKSLHQEEKGGLSNPRLRPVKPGYARSLTLSCGSSRLSPHAWFVSSPEFPFPLSSPGRDSAII